MSAISSVLIANMALSHVGARNVIESFDEQSEEARQCKLWYSYSLEQALECYDWSFARKRDNLALASDAAPAQWSYRYAYPADCIAMRRLWNPAGEQADAVPYELETQNSTGVKTILTDMNLAVGVYTMSVTDPSLFTYLFIELLSRGLAQHIAFTLTGKREIVQDQAGAYQAILRSAPAYDANERVGQPPRDAEWIRGRTFYYPMPSPPFFRQ